MSIILASQSPRRIELLGQTGWEFQVIPSRFDEDGVTAQTPAELVRKLALGKARAVLRGDGDIVIGCDTVVALQNTVFGKPRDREDARRMITALAGNTHSVITGVCILSGAQTVRQFECETKVRFFPLTEKEIEAYIDTDEPYDKAGGYGIQGKAGLFAESIEGDYNNVVGMPLSRVYREVKALLEGR